MQYPHWTGSRNTRGLPICMFDIGHLNNEVIASYKNDRDKAVSSNTKNELSAAQKAFAIHDGLIRFILPLCSSVRDRPEPDSPILSAVYLVDVSAFSLKQAWDLRTYAQDISKLLALSYPEVVDTVFVSGSLSLPTQNLISETGAERAVLFRANLEYPEKVGRSADGH